MMRLFRLLEAIYKIIERKSEITESSFSKPSPEYYDALCRRGYDMDSQWYILNSGGKSEEISIVSEEEKASLLEAMEYIYRESSVLGECSFEERLLYIKGIVPQISRPRV